jgi:hypothetical protein
MSVKYTIQILKDEAKKNNIKGFSGLSKNELINLILKTDKKNILAKDAKKQIAKEEKQILKQQQKQPTETTDKKKDKNPTDKKKDKKPTDKKEDKKEDKNEDKTPTEKKIIMKIKKTPTDKLEKFILDAIDNEGITTRERIAKSFLLTDDEYDDYKKGYLPLKKIYKEIYKKINDEKIIIHIETIYKLLDDLYGEQYE